MSVPGPSSCACGSGDRWWRGLPISLASADRSPASPSPWRSSSSRWPGSRPDRRRRRGGGEVIVRAMSDGAPSLPGGFLLHRYDTVGSTNDEARQLARDGAPGGTLVWAAAQSAGRGRRGHLWQSPPGNLYLSMVLRPEAPPANAPQLGFVAALALGDALDQLAAPGLQLRYKWPNDLLAGGKKLAGILLESEMAAGGGLDFVILGIGVNLVSAPRELEYPAPSLAHQGASASPPAAPLQALPAHFPLWALPL